MSDALRDLSDRLAHLELLADGWLDGHGRAPTPAAIAAARQTLEGLLLRHPEIPRQRDALRRLLDASRRVSGAAAASVPDDVLADLARAKAEARRLL